MLKKTIIIIIISLILLISCSDFYSPIEILDKEIIKYGIDIGLEDSVISSQIRDRLQEYYKDNGYYKLIFIGVPKSIYSQKNSISCLVLDEAEKMRVFDITMDIRNIEFQNGIINSSMFMGKPSENIVLNFVFPENTITIIEDFAFNGLHKNLKEVKIPDSVITINDNAFALNYSLEKLTLGNNIYTIEKNAFHYSTALTELTIPASVMVIKSGAFSGSSGSQLKVVTYLGTSPNNITFDGKIFSSTQLKTLKIPNASNPNDPAWKTFLGYNFEIVTR
ncbi:leucine-rich repeat domain-containing protein [Brachyspira murdochii]|uniref:leucine-rich repeat domain-containing protein n=1 Tax=Brachyspira murdochii TaxID=84378 RepID=UPI0012F4C9EE|nr:leucine-rich repeat domain-containing protein [Brachyspira murdochii]